MTKPTPRSKVSRLSRATREAISRMLLDGLTLETIAQKVNESGAATQLSAADIADWEKGGHQNWIEERERLAELERLRELAAMVTGSNEASSIQEASVQVAAAHLFELLAWFNPKVFKKKVHHNLPDYARVVNMLVKLSDGGLKYERYRAEVAERKAKMQKALEADKEQRGLSPEAREIIERELKLL